MDDLPDRDFTRFEGYWHGLHWIIFDEENPGTAWIASTYWVPVAGVPRSEDPDQQDHPD